MPKTQSPRSVTKLLGLGLSPGKLRGLQRISNPNGTMTMAAFDQNSSMIKMIQDSLKRRGIDREPTFGEIVEAKVDLVRELGSAASALLVDGYYGAWNSLASFSIPRNTGMLIRVEQSGGPKNDKGAPLGQIEPGWGVRKIKRMGADAVKLLAQFEPTEPHSAEWQLQLTQEVTRECDKQDILFLLEPVSFPFKQGETAEDKKSQSYLDRKPETVIESARQLSRYCDVYKAEFPGTLGHQPDEKLMDNLRELDAACERPWVLLSAGVDYPDYKRQVEMALECGASGVLGGRAFWKEYFNFDDAEGRRQFARTEALGRVQEIDAMVKAKGRPWPACYGLSLEDLSNMRAVEGWHFRYGGRGLPRGGKAQSSPGDVY